MIGLKSFGENSSGSSVPGSPDPARWQLLIGSPPLGMVRVPLSASIQCDSQQPFVTCHGRLERTEGPLQPGFDVSEFLQGPSFMGDPPRAVHLLWSLKLTPPVLVGGEFFIPVPAFPLIHGTILVADWSYATGGDAVRTRAVCVDVPIESFDWSTVTPLPGEPQHSVVEHHPTGTPDLALAALPLWPALWRHSRMRG